MQKVACPITIVVSEKLTPEKVKHAQQLYERQEHTVEEIGQLLGVSRKTVYRYLQGTPSRESERRLA